MNVETTPATTVLVVRHRPRDPRLLRVIMGMRCSLSLLITGFTLAIFMGIPFLATGDDGLMGVGIAMLVLGLVLAALGIILGISTRKQYKEYQDERATNANATANAVNSVSMAVPTQAYPHQPGGVYPPGVYPPQAGGAYSMEHPQQPPVIPPSHSESAYSPNTAGYPPQTELHPYQTGHYPPPQIGAYPPKAGGYAPQWGAQAPQTNTNSSQSQVPEQPYPDAPPPYQETEIPLK